MGYESRVIIAKRNTRFKGFAETIAELNLCGMEGDFLDLFDKEYDGNFYDFYATNVSDERVVKDRYGKPLKYATFNKVYKYCLNNAQRQRYRRLDMLLAVLNTVRTGWADEYNDFIIIHYGY